MPRRGRKISTKNWEVWKPQPRPPDYEDPDEVLQRQQLYLNRWKAQGKIINQPRIAWSLALARAWYVQRHYRFTPEWGHYLNNAKIRGWRVKGGRKRTQMPDWKEHCDRRRAKGLPKILRLAHDRAARARNPLAIPTEPKKVGKRLPL